MLFVRYVFSALHFFLILNNIFFYESRCVLNSVFIHFRTVGGCPFHPLGLQKVRLGNRNPHAERYCSYRVQLNRTLVYRSVSACASCVHDSQLSHLVLVSTILNSDDCLPGFAKLKELKLRAPKP